MATMLQRCGHLQRPGVAFQNASIPGCAHLQTQRIPVVAKTVGSSDSLQQRGQRAVGCHIALSDSLQQTDRHQHQQQHINISEPPQHKYLLGEVLGSGSAARVVVGTETATQAQYAVKILQKNRGSKNRTQQIQQEITISESLRYCRHAVKTVDSFEDARNIYVVQELCCGGDLADLMTAQEGQLSELEAATIIKCVLEFLADCHERSICYGDVKPNNFVLRSLYPCIAHLMDPSKPKGQLEVVAVDFGCCQEVGESCLPDVKVTGTPLYMAPENLKGCHGLEVDVWAAGVMLYQLLSDRFPFWDVDLYQIDSLGGAAIREGIMHGPVLFPLKPWFTSVHSSAQDLIVRMLERDVSKRITAAEALAHPWFEEVLGAAAAAGEVQRQTA